MNRFTPLLVCLLTATAFAAAPDDLPLAPAVECSPRAGLPNFHAKLKKGGEIRIAYLGGSITAQEGWRPKTLAHFRKSNPNCTFIEINAAIGGTGSDLGVFRLKQDVLDHKPDLLFIEFAVNDGGAPPIQIYRCIEGIIRQTRRTLPECDICHVYTLVDGFAPTLQEGKFPRAASAMEKIAGHYSIPSIHMGLEVARLAKAGTLILKGALPKTDGEKKAMGDKTVFSSDGVHPFPQTGHELYLQSILRSLPAIEKASGTPQPRTLPDPFIADNYEDAKMIPITRAKLSPGFIKLDPKADKLAKSFGKKLPDLHRANQPGQTIEFKFKGRHAALYDLLAPDAGQVIITFDGKPPVIKPRFDSFTTYARLATMNIASDVPVALHTVKLELHKDQPDKLKILSQRNEKIDDPARFNDTAWYPGAILLLGELVE